MKHFMLALPAVALMGFAASAQTESTTTGTEADASTMATGEMFGTNWPLSVGTTFFAGSDSATLRGTEEISSGWTSLSQEDRDMILADCQVFTTAHGGMSTDGSAATSTGTTAETGMSDTSTTGTADTSTTGTADTATTGTADTATTGTADTSTTGTADTATTGTADSATTGTADTATTGTADTSTTGADASVTAAAGYDMTEMKAICDAVSNL